MADDVEILPDGVYLDLEDATYFGQGRIGSTDLCHLHTEGPGWWWSSPHNPDYQPEPEDAKGRTFGKGLHARVLEGERAYAERFAIIQSKDELRAEWGDRFVDTVPEIKAALERRGLNPPGGKNKDFYVQLAHARAPDLVVYDTLVENWERVHVGKLPVPTEEDRQLQIMTTAIHEHPEMGELFKPGPDNRPITELSVLYTDEHGLKRRIRYDDVLPQTIIDLKALTTIGSRPLNFAIPEQMGRYAYHVQLADHLFGWKWLLRLISEGRMYGGSDADRAWLARFPEEAQSQPEYAWIWYRRPDRKAGRCPIVVPWVETYGSDLHMDGIRARRRAIATYQENVARFGLDRPWTVVQPVHTTDERATHRMFLPSWIAQEEIAGERDDL